MEIIQFIRANVTSSTFGIFIVMAIISLIVDAPRYKAQNASKEYKIIKTISYTYIAIGIVALVLLNIV